jgi:hypothetical protein
MKIFCARVDIPEHDGEIRMTLDQGSQIKFSKKQHKCLKNTKFFENRANNFPKKMWIELNTK